MILHVDTAGRENSNQTKCNYTSFFRLQPNYTAITGTCNIWRNFDDIQDSWQSVASVIDHYGDDQDTIIPNAGPGHWNDPDMLIIGNFGLSYEQVRQALFWVFSENSR